MEPKQILEELAHHEVLPKRAVEASLARPDDVVPEFLKILSRCADSAQASEEDLDAFILVIHILGELREKRAFQPLMDILLLDSARIDKIFGDVVTETLSRILISTFDGDTERLYSLIGNAEADEFVREAVLRVWTYLVLTGKIDNTDARRYLAGFPEEVAGADGDHIWVAWVDAVSVLGFSELSGAVEAAFSDGRIRSDMFGLLPLTLDDFRKQLAETLAISDREAWMRQNHYWPFEDTIGTLATWYGYSEEYTKRRRERATQAPYTKATDY